MSDAITTTAELIAVRAAETGDRPAVTFDGHTVTYAELDARAERAAAAQAAAAGLKAKLGGSPFAVEE
jgi:acyl-CoA synthetase (AMP-forming)/AMP-acid ligase II